MKNYLWILSGLLVVLMVCGCQQQAVNESTTTEPVAETTEPAPESEPAVAPAIVRALINTSKGDIIIELYADKTPQTVANFVNLANTHFYDGLIWHRVIDNFMIQGGGFNEQGQPVNSPGIPFEGSPELTHIDGAVSMASTGAKVGGSNQFFICDGAQPFLNGNYAVFGQVVSGIEVVRAIAASPVQNRGGPFANLPTPLITITKIEIITD